VPGAKSAILFAAGQLVGLFDKAVRDNQLPPRGEEAQEPIRLRLKRKELVTLGSKLGFVKDSAKISHPFDEHQHIVLPLVG
jgi:hypothetical protein